MLVNPEIIAEFATAGRVEIADLLDRLGLMAGYDIDLDDAPGSGAGAVAGRITGRRGEPFDAPVAFRFDEDALNRLLEGMEEAATQAYGGGRRGSRDQTVSPRLAARQLLNVHLDEELTQDYKQPVDELGVDTQRGWFVLRSSDRKRAPVPYDIRPGDDLEWSAEPGTL